MHESESAVFSPTSEIISESSFLIDSYIITVLFFFVERFGPNYNNLKQIILYFNFKNGIVNIGDYFHICV